jgi:branched-chain amino acid transport system permease protein
LWIKGFYLAVATLAAQFFIVWCLTKFPWFSNHSSSGVISAQKVTILGHAGSPRREKNTCWCLSIVAVMALAAKNMVRSSTGRAWMAVRDMDVAAEVIGIRLMPTKLLAFAVSSFYCGVAGALYAFCYLGSVEPDGFSLDMSFRILFMIIIGGMGSILGCFLGAAFILLLPIFLDITLPWLAGAVRAAVFQRHGVAHPDFGIRGADHVFPDRRATWSGPPVANRQGEVAAVAVPSLGRGCFHLFQ